tara:strand:- start:142 stop:414 length:273 start_codon:yes stop_codon:yes gene_type:complete
MTQKELIETIQQHHSSAGETQIRKALNRAQDDFSAKTKIIHVGSDNADALVAGQRYYNLPPEVLEIKRVEIDEVKIKRIIDRPKKGDFSG